MSQQSSRVLKHDTGQDKAPAYARIAAIVRNRIVDGTYPPGSKLPPETQFCAEFGVSAMTLRKALSVLTDQGLVFAERGRGTYVRSLALTDTVFKLEQWGSDWFSSTTEIRLLGASTVKADCRVAEMLSVKPGDRVVFLRRLIVKNGTPGMYHEEYLVSDVRQPLIESQLQLTSLRGVLDAARGRGFPYGRVTLRALCLDDQAAKVLEVAPGSAALRLEHIFENSEHRPISWGWFLMRADLFQLTGQLGSA